MILNKCNLLAVGLQVTLACYPTLRRKIPSSGCGGATIARGREVKISDIPCIPKELVGSMSPGFALG